MDMAQHEIVVPTTLGSYRLSESGFSQRFEKISKVEDPYVRFYDICRDNHASNRRVAVKDYAAAESDQEEAVLENLESYRKLGQVEGICKLVAFSKNQLTGDISAAFDFNEYTLEELMGSRTFEDKHNEFYLIILKEMLNVIESARSMGIELEELIPSSILFSSIDNEYHAKILYDEREKSYQKVKKGIKVFASIEKIETAIRTGMEYQSQDSEEAIFQLGLMLLDVIYELQSNSVVGSEVFSKDLPISRNNLLHKSYHNFPTGTTVLLNSELIDQKIKYILNLNVPFLKNFMQLVTQMLNPLSERITLTQVMDEAQKLALLHASSKNSIDDHFYDTPNKISPIKMNQSFSKPEDSLKYSDTINSGNFKNNIVSQTTVATNNNYTVTSNKAKDYDVSMQPKMASAIIPREKLLTQIKCNAKVIEKLMVLIQQLQLNINIIKKEYYDNSVYYGEVDVNNQKRSGHGIYVYTHGDIYFGLWKDNSLAQGSYIFKNGESYEGVVKNGKQGWGRYYYSNGNIYEGEWKDDVKSGQGKMIYPNRDVYEGLWSKGKKNGQGIYYYNNGTIYEGNFVNGKKNGYGVITFPNKTKVQAYWQQTHIEGPGKVFYTNGNYFQGNYHLSQKQGPGLYIWEDTQYEGEFKKDMMQGHARIKFSDDEYYEGRIKNGKREGHGTYRYSNGDQFTGEWKNDEKMIGRYKFRQGCSFDGRFKKNEMNYGVMVYDNGESYEGEFANGERHGIGSYRGATGELIYQGKWQRDQYVSSNL